MSEPSRESDNPSPDAPTEPSTPEQHAEIVVRNVRDHELFNVVTDATWKRFIAQQIRIAMNETGTKPTPRKFTDAPASSLGAPAPGEKWNILDRLKLGRRD